MEVLPRSCRDSKQALRLLSSSFLMRRSLRSKLRQLSCFGFQAERSSLILRVRSLGHIDLQMVNSPANPFFLVSMACVLVCSAAELWFGYRSLSYHTICDCDFDSCPETASHIFLLSICGFYLACQMSVSLLRNVLLTRASGQVCCL